MKLHSAEILRAYMNKRELSCALLAQYAGCSKSFIGFLAKGTKNSCTPKLAADIARALDVPLEALFAERTSAGSGQNVKGKAA